MNILFNFLEPEARHRTAFWAKQPIDDPQTIAGFNGTFAFTNHLLIPQGVTEFLLEHFHKKCFQAIELDEINELMNEIWEGPGSMNKLATLTNEMRLARLWEPEEEE
jgi:glucan phosphorylase